MEGTARDNIRSLLKEFGVRADEAIVTHLAKYQELEYLHLRITLEDLTPTQENFPVSPLSLTVEGEVYRTKPA
jgi:hypothetical protein